jgi:hypothetical protein
MLQEKSVGVIGQGRCYQLKVLYYCKYCSLVFVVQIDEDTSWYLVRSVLCGKSHESIPGSCRFIILL